jgi:hypothetical protein
MMHTVNNTPTTPQQDNSLADLAEKIRTSIRAGALAAANFLEHAMAAGDALIVAKTKVGHGGWLKFLRDCDLGDDRAEKYMTVARGRAELNSARARNLSLSAALRLLKPKSSPSGKKAKKATPLVLNSLAWSMASPEERRRFLDAIGLMPLLEALPPAWCAKVRERTRSNSPLSEKVTKALKAALSHANSKTGSDQASAIASLNAINALLASQGHDLHDLNVRISMTAKIKGTNRTRAA